MLASKVLLLSLLFLSAIPGQDYFPLQVGNVWIYKGSGTFTGSPYTVEITEAKQFNQQVYYHLLMPGSPFFDFTPWVREDSTGHVFIYDPDKNSESTWYWFQAPEGQPYDSTRSCCGKAMVQSRSAQYTGPVGTFDYALEMTYPGVFQVGISRELFLPYVGMIHREQATGGPSYGSLDLVYARLGDVTVVSAPEVSFTLSLDKAVYDTADMAARLALHNTQAAPLQLTFPSGQIYDLVIRNQNGDGVYRWSDGKGFAQVLQQVSVSGEKNWVVVFKPADASGKPLPPGQYTLEGFLTTMGPKSYAATVAFEKK